MSIIVGIDVGGSTTKIVGFRGTELLAPGLVKANDPIASIYGGFGRFTSDNGITLSDIDEVRITGVGSTYIGKDIYGIPAVHVNEFLADGLGGLYLSGLGEAVIVSMGTGTAFVYANRARGEYTYLGGTGVGGGIIIGGKIYTGFNFCGAELGHTVIEFNGRQCGCGRKGCFEAYSSATALINMTKEAMEAHKDSKMWVIAGGDIEKVDGKTAFDGMRADDEAAKGVINMYIEYLGCGLTNIVNTFQPEVLLIGGGICKEGENLTKPLYEIIKRDSYCVDEKQSTKLDICKLGNDAGIIGAAFLYSI